MWLISTVILYSYHPSYTHTQIQHMCTKTTYKRYQRNCKTSFILKTHYSEIMLYSCWYWLYAFCRPLFDIAGRSIIFADILSCELAVGREGRTFRNEPWRRNGSVTSTLKSLCKNMQQKECTTKHIHTSIKLHKQNKNFDTRYKENSHMFQPKNY